MNNRSIINLLVVMAAATVALSTLTSCTDHSKPNVELIQDMLVSESIKPQEYDETSPNHSGMRVPPEGTQPVGFVPYRYANDIEGAAKNKNPLAGDYSESVLKTGLKYYTTNCMICHGEQGEGGDKSSVGEKMALKPPSLLTAKMESWTDGQIYHVITAGQGVMGPYASHIPQKYRWQVVNYIRTLQKENK
ncbi:cytochrome c [bacterium]|nr:cytochrome c [bacterium]